MKSTVVKFPQIVAEALGKADCTLAGEVYQAIMAHELFGTEPTGLSPAADALYTLCMQFVCKPKRKTTSKKENPTPAPAAPDTPITTSPATETTPTAQEIPAPIFPDLDAPRVTTLQSAPRPGRRPPKSPERRQRYINRIRGKRKSASPPLVKAFFKNHRP